MYKPVFDRRGVSNYTARMTIAGRNKVLIFGICTTVLMVILSVICCILIITGRLLTRLPKAPVSSFWLLKLPIFSYNNYAVITAIVIFPLISLLLLLLLFFLFEKTRALEISFFSLFLSTFSVEALQLLFPLQARYPLTTLVVAFVARSIVFFRLLACLALLTSSLFAHKTFTRGTGAVIFLLSFIAFALSHTTPIDTIQAVSFFSFSRSYSLSPYSFSGIVCVLAVVSFLLAGISRNIEEYRKAALRLLIVLVSYAAIQYAGSWAVVVLGIPALLGGGFFFLKALHQLYLWQ